MHVVAGPGADGSTAVGQSVEDDACALFRVGQSVEDDACALCVEVVIQGE